MIVSALILGHLLGSAQTESPRLRTLLANGSSLLVERMPTAKAVSVQLFAGVRGVQETRATHGYRHLLEHLVLKGKDGQLDERLEAKGVFLVGRTFRDAMQIELVGPPAALDTMLGAIDEILSPRPFSESEIAAEARIMSHEIAQEGDASIMNRTAWTASFGDSVLDPIGAIDAIKGATPQALQDLSQVHFAPRNLVVVVCGPVDVPRVTEQLRLQFQDREGPDVEFASRRKATPGRLQTDQGFGEVRAGVAEGLSEAGATLAAAYAVAARLEGAYVTYTPSVGVGLVLVGRTDRNNTMGDLIDGLNDGDEVALMPIGKTLASQWLASLLANPSGSGFLRGLLMAQKPGASPDDLARAINTLTWPEFHKAIARFRKDRAVIAVGVRG